MYIVGLYLIAILQLSPFVDLRDMIKNGVDPEKKKASMRRDLMSKKTESGPQALFQSYIMFSLGSQRELLNVLSIAVSILSLSLGLVDYYMQPADEDAGEEKLGDNQGPDMITSSVQGEVVGAPQDMASEEKGVADVRVEIAQDPDLIGSSPEGEVVGEAENDTDVARKQLLRASTMQLPQLDVKLDRPDSAVRMLYAGKLAAFAYLSLDMTLRSIAFAVNFSPAARGPGVAVATVFAAVYVVQHPVVWGWIAVRDKYYEWFMQVVTRPSRNRRRNLQHTAEDEEQQAEPSSPPPVHPLVALACCPCWIVVLVIWICIVIVFVCSVIVFWTVALSLILVAVLLQTLTASTEVVTDCTRDSARRLAALRFLEYICHGVIIATIARTACGEPAMLEIQVFFPLLGLNLASYVTYVMLQYKVQKLAKCEEAVIGKCNEILSPCLDSLGFMAGSCKACVMNCLYCNCCAKTVEIGRAHV